MVLLGKAFYEGGRIAGAKYSDRDNKLLDLWLEECNTCHFWFPFKNIVLISERPTTLKVNNMGRLDCIDDMAIKYSDGWGVYSINGVMLDEKYFKDPLTTNIIDECTNTEQRRVLITKYGTQKYIQDSGAIKIHSDEWGTLYRKERQGDTPIEMVKVVNSTPEPDGSFKDYFLRVSPDLKPLPPGHWPEEKKREFIRAAEPQELTAHNAVASTFGLRGCEYSPEVET